MAKAERWKYAGHEGLKKGGTVMIITTQPTLI